MMMYHGKHVVVVLAVVLVGRLVQPFAPPQLQQPTRHFSFKSRIMNGSGSRGCSSTTTSSQSSTSTTSITTTKTSDTPIMASSSMARLATRTTRTTTTMTTTTTMYMSPNNEMEYDENTIPQVFPQRWIQLGYLSMLALISDWICFSVAAIPGTYEQAFSHSAASLIDFFLFTNVVSSFLVTDVVDRFGLQKAIQGAAILMAIRCWFRSGLSFLPVIPQAPHLMSYASVVIGTIMVGAAQPFFQCTPPVLSATWFAASERATSTAIALNFNQIGIATAFLVGGAMATTVSGLESYFGVMALAATMTAVGALLQFQNEPPIPPSTSELEKKIRNFEEPPFLESVQKFFQTRGFTNALAAFICSISITNIVGAFLDDILKQGGITDQLNIDLAGAGFELAILIGGIIIGGFVDKSKEYKKVTLACLLTTIAMSIPLGFTDHFVGKEPILLVASLLGLGMAAGPIQPISAELAVDVTYPGDETAVESVQQVGGNLVSALLIPVAEFLSKRDINILPGIPILESDIRGDALLLVGIAAVTLAYFGTFDAPLARTLADDQGENSKEGAEQQDKGGSSSSSSSSGEPSSQTATTTIVSVDTTV